jgi:hypothetical protein
VEALGQLLARPQCALELAVRGTERDVAQSNALEVLLVAQLGGLEVRDLLRGDGLPGATVLRLTQDLPV